MALVSRAARAERLGILPPASRRLRLTPRVADRAWDLLEIIDEEICRWERQAQALQRQRRRHG